MQLKEYRAIRESGKELGNEIFKFITENHKNDLMSAAKLLGFWNGKIMVFEKEMDIETMMDFIVFEKMTQNAPAFKRYFDINLELNDLQHENRTGMLNFYSSLFELKHIDLNNNTLVLKDLIDSDKEYLLMDVGMSQTASIGYIFYMRLIPIRDINMTSGLSFAFQNRFKDKLLSAFSLAKIKKRRKLTSAEMFLLIHEKNRQYGLDTRVE
ncbi:MAG: hypothetical protein GZ094_19815 [Mariniphaga sp.]|nr:hypothetical protein [Mariniphaga sp.]